MNMVAAIGGRHECLRQAAKCRSMGSEFVASILEAVDRQLLHAPITADMVIGWPGDPGAAAVAMRINGALHALARRGRPEILSALYRGEHHDFDGSIATALSQEDRFIADWIQSPTQTNEVARAAAIMSALMALPLEQPMPFQLLELGSSCGLNLNLARYSYRLGSVCMGDPLSAVQIEPQWRGACPPAVPIQIATAQGIDLHPLNASDASDRERLLSFTWADQPARSKRLEEALQIAVEHPPRIARGEATDWLSKRLAEPQRAGHCRAVVHTMFLQYLSDRDHQIVTDMMTDAGNRATVDRPLAWIGLEWTTDRRQVELRLTSWPKGETVVLAKCHPYGDWIDWLDR